METMAAAVRLVQWKRWPRPCGFVCYACALVVSGEDKPEGKEMEEREERGKKEVYEVFSGLAAACLPHATIRPAQRV